MLSKKIQILLISLILVIFQIQSVQSVDPVTNTSEDPITDPNDPNYDIYLDPANADKTKCTTAVEAEQCLHLCCDVDGVFCADEYGDCGTIVAKESCKQFETDRSCTTCCFRQQKNGDSNPYTHWCGSKEDCDEAIAAQQLIYIIVGSVVAVIVIVVLCVVYFCVYKPYMEKKRKLNQIQSVGGAMQSPEPVKSTKKRCCIC